jgi:serine/threonine protein kinase
MASSTVDQPGFSKETGFFIELAIRSPGMVSTRHLSRAELRLSVVAAEISSRRSTVKLAWGQPSLVSEARSCGRSVENWDSTNWLPDPPELRETIPPNSERALTVHEIGRKLVRLQLISQSDLNAALDQLGRSEHRIRIFLQVLEQRHLLTPFQVSRIARGETDGLVLGGYKLLYRNASGSFARIYRACGLQDQRQIALKVLRQRWAHDPHSVSQFHREAELGRSLKHENIVPMYDLGQDGNQHFISMEFVEGGSLRDFIKIRQKLTPVEATKCVQEMTHGLNYAAGRGITHRDLKLSNVLVSSQGVAKLVDFGLAVVRASNERNSSDCDAALDGGEGMQRALDYATLEKGTDVPRGDSRSDLYFLGTIYYELLTGVAPLERTRDRNERRQFRRYQEVVPLSAFAPNLPRRVTAVVDRLMQLNPFLRHQTPGEVLRDLQSVTLELQRGSHGDVRVSQPRATPTTGTNIATTVMFIERRQKNQDILREYLTRQGYRVLLLTDLQRGLNRLESSPPDCVVIMAAAFTQEALQEFLEARAASPNGKRVTILVLGETQSEWKSRVAESSTSRVLVQPLNLRELLKEIKRLVPERNADVDGRQADQNL